MTPEHLRTALFIGSFALRLQEQRPNSTVRIRTEDECVLLEAEEIVGEKRFVSGNRRDMLDIYESTVDPSWMGADLAARVAKDLERLERLEREKRTG